MILCHFFVVAILGDFLYFFLYTSSAGHTYWMVLLLVVGDFWQCFVIFWVTNNIAI